MGRSVSYPSGSIVKLYVDISSMGSDVDEEHYVSVTADIAQMEYEENMLYFQGLICKSFKSMSRCEKWLRDENLTIAENSYAYIGLSDYCGLLCVWVCPKSNIDYNLESLANKWILSIEKKLSFLVGEVYGHNNLLNRIGTFSNGESIYEKKGG